MKLTDFDYELPKELIAQEPIEPRDASRLMVLKDKEPEHKKFKDIIGFFNKGDVLVLNNTKVDPVKLVGRKKTGSPVELILSKRISDTVYECQVKTNKVREGMEFVFARGVEAKVISGKNGIFSVEFNKDIEENLDDVGEMPLPPYITKKATKEQYQTVYAKHSGSIAAPTAGFHFTSKLLSELEEKGVKIVHIILHVGIGTFLPVKSDDITQHTMHKEDYEISESAAHTINERKGNLVVVGTTGFRALESSAGNDSKVIPGKGSTDLFVYPGYDFKIKPDMMITNFHLPKSTLIMLISALYGREKLLHAYEVAVHEKYRFYSFGDAMLLVTHPNIH
ncbi:tRNA preQ1(34) S-adenosylmethionine ribosyltransferase-isomerase QueA [Candidatus Woesearchaeota archaeon]|nr:tRNA preQ1(34) S-adenosylmethionine ribosyltransferase-isomerase QueA [Candidatus Woesearchaeota archaeon]